MYGGIVAVLLSLHGRAAMLVCTKSINISNDGHTHAFWSISLCIELGLAFSKRGTPLQQYDYIYPNYFREMTRLLLLFALVTSVGTLVPTVMISLTALKALDFRNLSPVL